MSEDQLLDRFPRRTRRRQRTRARILAAATDQFRKVGYGAATMQAIADAADVHVTTLFTHFKTKSDLAISLTDRTLEKLQELIEESQGQVPFFDFFRRIVLSTARSIGQETDPTMTIWHELRGDRELAFAWGAYEQSQIALFAGYIAHDYELDTQRDYTPLLVSGLLVSSTLISHRRWSENSTRLNLEGETLKALEAAEFMARAILEPTGARSGGTGPDHPARRRSARRS